MDLLETGLQAVASSELEDSIGLYLSDSVHAVVLAREEKRQIPAMD